MAFALYDIIVPTYLQTLGSVRGFLNKGLEHAKAKGLDPQTLVDSRLIDDMHPLNFQIQRVASLSYGCLSDVHKGAFTMPQTDNLDYAGLQRVVAEAEAGVKRFTKESVNALEGKPFNFEVPKLFQASYTAEAFLLSISLPNFYFHAVTAYDILRAKGVKIGKRDYTGEMRMKVG